MILAQLGVPTGGNPTGVGIGDLFASVGVGQIGLAGLLTLVVMLILTGRLITKSALENERTNTKEWRATAERQQEINRIQADANVELLSLARSSNHALTELQALGTRREEEDKVQ